MSGNVSFNLRDWYQTINDSLQNPNANFSAHQKSEISQQLSLFQRAIEPYIQNSNRQQAMVQRNINELTDYFIGRSSATQEEVKEALDKLNKLAAEKLLEFGSRKLPSEDLKARKAATDADKMKLTESISTAIENFNMANKIITSTQPNASNLNSWIKRAGPQNLEKNLSESISEAIELINKLVKQGAIQKEKADKLITSLSAMRGITSNINAIREVPNDIIQYLKIEGRRQLYNTIGTSENYYANLNTRQAEFILRHPEIEDNAWMAINTRSGFRILWKDGEIIRHEDFHTQHEFDTYFAEIEQTYEDFEGIEGLKKEKTLILNRNHRLNLEDDTGEPYFFLEELDVNGAREIDDVIRAMDLMRNALFLRELDMRNSAISFLPDFTNIPLKKLSVGNSTFANQITSGDLSTKDAEEELEDDHFVGDWILREVEGGIQVTSVDEDHEPRTYILKEEEDGIEAIPVTENAGPKTDEEPKKVTLLKAIQHQCNNPDLKVDIVPDLKVDIAREE